MIKFSLFNKKSFLRAMLVGVVAGLFGSVVSVLISRSLDMAYRITDSAVLYGIFYALSDMRPVIVAALWVAIIALFSNWIFYPSFLAFSHKVAESLKLEESAPAAKLPKQFAELEQELDTVRKDLQLWKYATKEAENRKDELVVYLAHDIRTPLTSVLGYLELLDETEDLPAENRRQFTATALRKARRMKDLVEELFEVTRFNVSRIELQKEPVRAGIMLRQLAEEMEPILSEKDLSINFETEENTTLFVDPGKLARAADNVLHNAAYYSPRGGKITVKCFSDEKNGMGVISISNEGSEISQAELDRCFEKFYRGDTARQSASGGSGLGLAIAKNIVEAHGGKISAHNENRVTTFTIQVPL